jgi:hypothetical protein
MGCNEINTELENSKKLEGIQKYLFNYGLINLLSSVKNIYGIFIDKKDRCNRFGYRSK